MDVWGVSMISTGMDPAFCSSTLRRRFWWPFILLVAAVAYLYGLDGYHIPKIGDEDPYVQIVRLTAASGTWLPLRSPEGIGNTKPPLLFWQGIFATDWGRHWNLFRLRLPTVVYTFLTAGLVFFLARRMAGNVENGHLAALTFLGFFSTFQYGRPFLTNLPETFFVFLPFFCLLYFRDRMARWGLSFWLFSGLSFGMAFLYKSFALAVPVALSLTWYHLVVRRWSLKAFLAKDAANVTAATLMALSCFALWPAFDPDPHTILTQFVLGENVGKLSRGDYLRGLFSGPYPVFNIWFGNLANAGFFALPLIALVGSSVKQRAALSAEEKALWIVVLSFMIAFSIPGQRQENYLLPTVPALAVLLGTRWTFMRRGWFYLFTLPVVLALAGLTGIMFSVSQKVLPAGYEAWQLTIPLLALALGLASLLYNRIAPFTFHLLVVMVFIALSCALAPFDGPLGKYADETVRSLQGQTVYIPSNFRSSYERHRFLLPGVEIAGYDMGNGGRPEELLRAGQIVAVRRHYGDSLVGPYAVYGSRLTVRSRHTDEEIREILLGGRLELLVQKEIIVRLPSPATEGSR